MFEPFIWMFKVDGFKTHFNKLISVIFIFWVPLFLSVLIINSFSLSFWFIEHFYFIILGLIILLLPFLCVSGYFWSLTDNIIYRDTDIITDRIFNNNIKVINIINLPDWNIFKFIWRGVASIVATIILCIPIALILGFFSSNIQKIAAFWGWTPEQIIIFTCISFVILWFSIPALLWNYARRDSVFAVLNFPKAFYIMTTYPRRYIMYVLKFVLVSIIQKLLVVFIGMLVDTNMILSIFNSKNFELSGFNTVLFIVYVLVCYILNLYFLFVYSYLLGTLTPANEN